MCSSDLRARPRTPSISPGSCSRADTNSLRTSCPLGGDALGAPLGEFGDDALEEALAVIRGCWSGQAFSFSGAHYSITDHRATPVPVQQPGPPILIGGGGPRILRLAGAHADIVGINPNLKAGAITADAAKDALAAQTLQKVEWIKEGAGDRFDAIELQIRYFFAQVTDDANGLAETMAPMFDVSAADALESGVFLAGTVDQICDTLVERRETWGVSNIVFGNDNFEMLAPVVARLAGT